MYFNKGFSFLINCLLPAVLSLRCFAWSFSSCSEQGLLFVSMHRLPTAVASLVVENRL